MINELTKVSESLHGEHDVFDCVLDACDIMSVQGNIMEAILAVENTTLTAQHLGIRIT